MKRLLAAAAMLLSLASPVMAADEETEALNHGYATAAYEKVCGTDLVITDAALRAKKDRLYRKSTAYMEGYRWVANQADAALAPNFLMIYNFCTGAASAKWAKVPADRKQWLENKISSRRGK